jgi:hypothetical protein
MMKRLRSPGRTSPTARSERGAVFPIVALIIVILLVFAAFTVDLGAAWAERRQDQSAVDAAAMAGALEYTKGTPDSLAALAKVKEYAAASLGISDADWLTANCTDSDHYALIDPSIQCISLASGDTPGAVLRVRLPDRDVPTSFARVIGINEIPIHAVAEAQVDYMSMGPVKPWSLPSNPDSHECLGTPPDGLLSDPDPLDPCGGSESGNFGLLDSPWFGNPLSPYVTAGCVETSDFDNRTTRNIALGLDHLILKSPDPPASTAIGRDDCAAVSTPTYVPWVLHTQPGFTHATLDRGMLGDPQFGTTNQPGLLRQTGGLNGGGGTPDQINLLTRTGSAHWADNVGLWEYLDPSNGPHCDPASFTISATGPIKTGRDLTQRMVDCLDHAPTFLPSLLTSPRFAVVPSLDYVHCDFASQYPDCLTGGDWVHVLDFIPLYVQGTWYDCGNPAAECLFQPEGFGGDEYTPVFYPGEGTTDPVIPDPGHSGTYSRPDRLETKGVSGLVLDWNWLTPENADELLGESSPFRVQLYG